MSDFFELFSVVFFCVLPSIAGCYIFLRKRKEQGRVPISVGGLAGLYWPFATILLVTAFTLKQEDGLDSIGLDFARIDEFFGGFLFCMALVIVLVISSLLFKIAGKTERQDCYREQLLDSLCKSGVRKRIVWIATLIVWAVAEEMLYRGYFLLLWGFRSDYFLLWMLVVSAVFVMSYLSQGWSVIPTYIMLTVLVTLPALATGSILISIGIHVCWNIYAVCSALWACRKRKVLVRIPPVEPGG